jgi:hypothetical protein
MSTYKRLVTADKAHDTSTGLTEVTEAYTKLVDCIATHRDRRIMRPAEDRSDIRQGS